MLAHCALIVIDEIDFLTPLMRGVSLSLSLILTFTEYIHASPDSPRRELGDKVSGVRIC